MLVSCRYCSGVHQRSFSCPAQPKRYGRKEQNSITKFRNTAGWKRKRAEIKQRDKFMCTICKLDNVYTFEGLDVHHIEPISEQWEKRLTNSNLITLCKYHHSQADRNEIDRAILYRLSISAEHIQRIQ